LRDHERRAGSSEDVFKRNANGGWVRIDRTLIMVDTRDALLFAKWLVASTTWRRRSYVADLRCA
jgi:hypothetical protein